MCNIGVGPAVPVLVYCWLEPEGNPVYALA